jgi:hypothetical protein
MVRCADSPSAKALAFEQTWQTRFARDGRKRTVQETRQPQWFVILVFTSLALFFLGLVYYLTADSLDKPASEFSNSPLYRNLSGLGDTADNIYLNLDQWKSVDGLMLRFNGLDGPFLLIDVIIPQLDHEFAYSHRIPIQDAESGFRLVNRGFLLTFARGSRIRLKLEDAADR